MGTFICIRYKSGDIYYNTLSPSIILEMLLDKKKMRDTAYYIAVAKADNPFSIDLVVKDKVIYKRRIWANRPKTFFSKVKRADPIAAKKKHLKSLVKDQTFKTKTKFLF